MVIGLIAYGFKSQLCLLQSMGWEFECKRRYYVRFRKVRLAVKKKHRVKMILPFRNFTAIT